MSVEVISSIAGIVVSLMFEYVPGLREKYNELSDNYQKLIMLVVLLSVVLGAFVLSCAGLSSYYECSTAGLWDVVRAFIAALIANQSTHRILPK